MGVTEATLWCQNTWRMLSDGGTWAVPRSGLIYRKDEIASRLVLISRMPHHPDMPMTPAQLREQQDADHEGNRQMFTLIGVDVTCDIKAEPKSDFMDWYCDS